MWNRELGKSFESHSHIPRGGLSAKFGTLKNDRVLEIVTNMNITLLLILQAVRVCEQLPNHLQTV